MKKLMMMMVVLFVGLQISAQKEIEYGDIRKDGYEKITKGAFWKKRPEAKMIYEGSYPLGFNVYRLKKDHFVRFVDGEHNSLDINYIVFPEGEKVYTNESGQFFSAKCGNRIVYIKPVEMVKVKIVEVPLEPSIEYQDVPMELGGQQEPVTIINNYYSYGYSDEGNEILYDRGGEQFYSYNSRRSCYTSIPFTLIMSWGCYRTYNDYCMGRNYGTVGGYYNQVVNNIDNSITNIDNSNTNININKRRETNPVDQGGPGGANTQPANPGGPGGVDTQPVDGRNPGGANTGKSARIDNNQQSRRSSTSNASNSLKSASRSSGYRTSDSNQRSSAGYRTSSASNRNSSSFYRGNSSNRSSRARMSSSSYGSGRSKQSSSGRLKSAYSGRSSMRSSNSGMRSSRGSSMRSSGGSRSMSSGSHGGSSGSSRSGRR